MNIITFIKCKYWAIKYWKNKYVFYQRHNIPIKNYCGRKTQKMPTIDKYLYDAIKENGPLFYGRLGQCEARVLLESELQKYKNNPIFSESNKNDISNNAGMFSNNNKEIERFAQYQKESIKNMTGMKIWYIRGEELMIKNYASKKMFLVKDEHDYTIPWQSALSGKKVLVVSSFSKTIKSQYKKRNKLFKDSRMLPDFYLETEQKVVSLAGNKPKQFDSWEKALMDTFHRCMEHDFEYAIIGAGSYSLPLGDLLFREGKKVIVLNSDIQTMFGIYGERHLNASWFDKTFINDYWVRPSDEEKPDNYKAVEDGAYW